MVVASVMLRKTLFALGALYAISANAAPISIGILGGAPFTDVVTATTQNNFAFVPKSTNFVVGPTFRLDLPLNLRVEVDALYRPYSFSATCAAPTLLGVTCAPSNNVTANQWRFPFLAQYRIKIPVVQPFIEGGLSFDHLSNISAAADNITAGAGQLVQQSHASVVLGGGVDLKLPILRLSGELRYSHQGSADFRAISNVNQAEFLFGIHF
jgi:hypothetical protein